MKRVARVKCACKQCGTEFERMPWEVRQGRNTQDAARKGRMPRGENHHLRLHPELCARGEEIGASKLTSDQVKEIRQRHVAGKWGARKRLADEYGVTTTQIHNIVSGKQWRHIQ